MKDPGPLLHGGIGFVLGALARGACAWFLPYWAGLLLVALVCVGGFLREKFQHPPFKDPLTWWQRLEALAWSLAIGGWFLAELVV